MTESEQTHLVKASERRREHTPTPGMLREEAVRTQGMWAGVAHTAGGAFSGWHHHGAYESVIYVVKGRLRLEYGRGGKSAIEASAGDTVYVAPGEVHREGNPDEETSELMVVRGGSGELVVNTDGPATG